KSASVCRTDARSRMRKGNRWLRRALVEAAWAASRVKKSYLRAQFRLLAPRRGKNRALVAVGHSLLVIIYHVLKYNVEYRDLGPDYLDRLEPERLRRYLVKRLQSRLRRDAVAQESRRPRRVNYAAPVVSQKPKAPWPACAVRAKFAVCLRIFG